MKELKRLEKILRNARDAVWSVGILTGNECQQCEEELTKIIDRITTIKNRKEVKK